MKFDLNKTPEPIDKATHSLGSELAHEMRKHFGQAYSTQEAIFFAVAEALNEIRKLNDNNNR